MKIFKKLLTGLAMAAAFSGAAHASMINVGGVSWDPDAVTDFSSQSVNMRQMINPLTGELSGFGIITAMNGSFNFCAGCELTFQFGGFMPTGGTLIPGIGQTVSYTGGQVNVYVGAAEIANPADYTALTAANTGNGELWLALQNNYTFLGTNIGNALLSGLGFLDVVGGAAAFHFDTNGRSHGADLAITTSLSHLNNGIIDTSGTGNFAGNTVPEPGSIALLGLGLLGAAFARRRKLVK